MTSEIETFKTNEFLRRRKLRLQQVREQSKDIAKKIRQRTKNEKLRHIVDLDRKKEKEYLERQGKLVKRLEQLYLKKLHHFGASHKSAVEVKQNEELPQKLDVSKLRGKEAVADLRKRKQEKLDEQKKLLDRKLQARAVANEISRDKSSVVVNKLKLSTKDTEEPNNIQSEPLNNKESDINNVNNDNAKDKHGVRKNDMATQWDFENLPTEWESNIPELTLPKDDCDTVKELNNNIESKSEKSRKIDLFALSDEMPSSLRGGLLNHPNEEVPAKSSLTLVSEYLQSRGLRLRDTDVTVPSKKQVNDLQNIKQTILKSRLSKTEGNPFNNVCHVLDGEVIPLPSWQAEKNCEFCFPTNTQHKYPVNNKQLKSATNSQLNEIFNFIKPIHRELPPSPVLRGMSPFRRSNFFPRGYKRSDSVTINNKEKTKSDVPHIDLSKKKSIMMYNHSTRDIKDVTNDNEKLVFRDLQTEDDAFSQAMKQNSIDNIREKEHEKNLQDMRNKIAMTKQHVEKEYKDTMAFLNSLPKNNNKPIKKAFMDERRQQMQKDRQQMKLQHEFKNIEKDYQRHSCESAKRKNITPDKRRSKSKSPARVDIEDEFAARDFQYSWMPVPESDGNLAIHTIPITLKDGKSGNTVKFSKVDSYHEYRSRHKHTPPTKDTAGQQKQANKKVLETVIIHQNDNESTDCSSIATDADSVENLKYIFTPYIPCGVGRDYRILKNKNSFDHTGCACWVAFPNAAVIRRFTQFTLRLMLLPIQGD